MGPEWHVACLSDTHSVLLIINCYHFRFEILTIDISFYCTGFEILAVRNYLDCFGGLQVQELCYMLGAKTSRMQTMRAVYLYTGSV
jgi:hypothetical protein